MRYFITIDSVPGSPLVLARPRYRRGGVCIPGRYWDDLLVAVGTEMVISGDAQDPFPKEWQRWFLCEHDLVTDVSAADVTSETVEEGEGTLPVVLTEYTAWGDWSVLSDHLTNEKVRSMLDYINDHQIGLDGDRSGNGLVQCCATIYIEEMDWA